MAPNPEAAAPIRATGQRLEANCKARYSAILGGANASRLETEKMKKFLPLLAALLLIGAAHAQSESECLSSGKIAEGAALSLQKRVSEDYIAKRLTDSNTVDKSMPKAAGKVILESQLNIVSYVYTLRLAPADARAMVYTKCRSGGLGHIDWSKHPRAWRDK